MLVNIDVKSLEVVVAAQLSGDKVLGNEIRLGQDIHANNMAAFGLPSRLIAKIFVFRLIYGGSAYSYANDIQFKDVSTSEDFWQNVIDNFYEKYYGIARWHKELVATAQRERRIEVPSGRYYSFEPEVRRNQLKWPITKIKNYPVQGFGADLVMLARLEAKRLLAEYPVDFVSTVHDSIVVDSPGEYLDDVARLLLQAVQSVPSLCKEKFNYDFDLPLTGEVQYGPNKRDMQEYKFM